MGLASTLTDRATDTVKRQFVSELEKLVAEASQKAVEADRAVTAARQAWEAAVADVNAKKEALEAIKKVFKIERGKLLYYGSRSRRDGPGHFIELFSDGSTTCSCEGGRYNGKCWAQDHAKANAKKVTPDRSYDYLRNSQSSFPYVQTTVESFDKRVKPRSSLSTWNFVPLTYR